MEEIIVVVIEITKEITCKYSMYSFKAKVEKKSTFLIPDIFSRQVDICQQKKVGHKWDLFSPKEVTLPVS